MIDERVFALQHTLLCKLMVYSRVTTSEMAERCFLPVCWTLDISDEEIKGQLSSAKKNNPAERLVVFVLTEGVSAVLAEVVDCRGDGDSEMSFFEFPVRLACVGSSLLADVTWSRAFNPTDEIKNASNFRTWESNKS